MGKVVVHPHVGEWGDVRGRDGAEVDGAEVVVQGVHRRERERGVTKWVGAYLVVVEVLGNRPGDGFDPGDLLCWFFRRRADPLKTVFCKKILYMYIYIYKTQKVGKKVTI